jgi:hypothetical protein
MKLASPTRHFLWVFRQFWSQVDALANAMAESDEEAISRLSPKRRVSCSSPDVRDSFSASNNSILAFAVFYLKSRLFVYLLFAHIDACLLLDLVLE